MRTAMVLARLGTVSAAAEALGIHRATVSRHIDVLERNLGNKLFLRHKNGYTLTRDGKTLADVAESADKLISSYVEQANAAQHGLSGRLSISAIGRVFFMFAPAFKSFQEAYPNVKLKLNAESRNAMLELGEADIAIRSGKRSEDPDHVVIPLREFSLGLSGHKNYFARYGLPQTKADLLEHRFVAVEFPDRTCDVSELYGIPADNIAVYTNDPTAMLESVNMSMGLGMVAHIDLGLMPDLIEVLPRQEPFSVPLHLLTHVDQHRTPLVQAFVQHIRDYSQSGFDFNPSLSADPNTVLRMYKPVRE